MFHLTVHFIDQVQLCRLVHFHWMYPFEKNNKILKGDVCNHYLPTGCIAQCYIAKEALKFCAEYLSSHDFNGLPLII